MSFKSYLLVGTSLFYGSLVYGSECFTHESINLSNFCVQTYNALPSVEDSSDAVLKSGKMDDFLDRAKSAISDYDSVNFMGVRLLHNHNPLKHGEKMVEEFGSYEEQPAFITSNHLELSASCFPASWIITDSGLRVFEYSADSKVAESLQYIAEHKPLLAILEDQIRAHNFEAFLSPSILERKSFDAFNVDDSLVEKSRYITDEGRDVYENIVTGVTPDLFSKMSALQTSWSLYPGPRQQRCLLSSWCQKTERNGHVRVDGAHVREATEEMNEGGQPKQVACARVAYCRQVDTPGRPHARVQDHLKS